MHHIHHNHEDDARGDDWIDTLTSSHLRAVVDDIATLDDDFDDPSPGDDLDALLATFESMMDEAAEAEDRRHGVPWMVHYGDIEVDLYDFDPDNRGTITAYAPEDPRLDELHAILACNDPTDLRLTTAALDWLLADFPKPRIVDQYGLDANLITAYLLMLVPSLDASEWFSGMGDVIIDAASSDDGADD